MTGIAPVRASLARIAFGVRAGVFLTALTGTAAMGQAVRRASPPPRFYRPPAQQNRPQQQQARPQPQQGYRPQPAQPPAYRPQPQQQGQPQQTQGVRPMEQPAQRPATGSALVNPGHPGQMSQHLGPWMQGHSNLTPAQQHQALENEPGFHNLQPAEQERLHNQLTRLNNMPPAQRDRRIRNDEAMERLAPAQRKQVNNALGQFGALPEYRQAAVKRAYMQLRDLPPAQSQAMLSSPQYRSQFNDEERSTIGNMVNAAPLLRGFEEPPPQQIPHD